MAVAEEPLDDRFPCPDADRSCFVRTRQQRADRLAQTVLPIDKRVLDPTDVEELLTERGIEVDHVTVYRWVQRFTPLLGDAARPGRHALKRFIAREVFADIQTITTAHPARPRRGRLLPDEVGS